MARSPGVLMGSGLMQGATAPGGAGIALPQGSLVGLSGVPATVDPATDLTVTFTVRRTGDLGSACQVNWTVEPGIGSSPADESLFADGVFPGGIISFTAGQTTATIPFQLAANARPTVAASAQIRLSAPVGCRLAPGGGVAGFVIQGSAVTSPSSVALTADSSDVTAQVSQTTPLVLVFGRAGDLSDACSIDWAVEGSGDNPATGGLFNSGNLPSGTRSWSAGDGADQTVTLLIAAGAGPTAAAGATVRLRNPAGCVIDAQHAVISFVIRPASVTPPPPPPSDEELPTPTAVKYVPDDYPSANAALAAAQPGWQIRVRASAGAQGAISSGKAGTAAQPIVVTADVGPVKNGTGWTMPKLAGVNLSGAYVWIRGFDLGAGEIVLQGTRNGLLRCWRHGFNGAKSSFNCSLVGSRCFIGYSQINTTTTGLKASDQSRQCDIFRNYIFDNQNTLGTATNGYETIQLANNKQWRLTPVGALVDHNLLQDCNTKGGEEETISLKSAGNIIRQNTMINTRHIENRQGVNNQILSNLLKSGSAGIHVFDGPGVINGNKVTAAFGIALNAGSTVAGSDFIPNDPQCTDWTVVRNSGTKIALGVTFDRDDPVKYPVLRTKLGDNAGMTISQPGASGTVRVQDSAYSSLPIEEVTPADVGPGAPWRGWPVR